MEEAEREEDKQSICPGSRADSVQTPFSFIFPAAFEVSITTFSL
jgi:hypothetical protein